MGRVSGPQVWISTGFLRKFPNLRIPAGEPSPPSGSYSILPPLRLPPGYSTEFRLPHTPPIPSSPGANSYSILPPLGPPPAHSTESRATGGDGGGPSGVLIILPGRIRTSKPRFLLGFEPPSGSPAPPRGAGAGEPIGGSNPRKNRGLEVQTRPGRITYFI
jgi:hypothetical protein